jgi:hypothetical protein
LRDYDQIEDVLALIRQAKSSHIRWRAYAQGLVCLFAVDDEVMPVEHTECRFGQWYFSGGMKTFGDSLIFQAVQWPHKMLHVVDREIHDLAKEQRVADAEAKLEQLTGISRALIEQLERLEREVAAKGVAR